MEKQRGKNGGRFEASAVKMRRVRRKTEVRSDEGFVGVQYYAARDRKSVV